VDSIRQAVELARTNERSPPSARPASEAFQVRNVPLNAKHLESTRIVTHDPSIPAGAYYDMLRTQVLHEMDENDWQFLGITSATAGCGKSVTACNLAFSIARLTERSVLLVDMDMRKPKVTEYLGIKKGDGILSLLEGRTGLSSVTVEASIGRNKILVLPGEHCKTGSSEWMASQNMINLLQTLKREFRSRLVIFDMPPMLVGDDVISVLPQMDALLLVAGVGATSIADIKQCQKHLKTTPVVRVVVNRVTEANDAYYGYY
jgi:Mrp family chromosome partitioning ATPase